MAKKKIRKKHRKYQSKYYKKYGYSIRDVVELLKSRGWSYGTVHAYFQDPFKRKEMLDLVKIEEQGK